MTGEVSVRPYPSRIRTPTSANQPPRSMPSGAPPETKTLTLPPKASAIFEKTSFRASFHIGLPGILP